jgi:hypothetical protein
MERRRTLRCALAGLVVLGAAAAAAAPGGEKRLPEGDEGLAARHPGDTGLAGDRDVVFVEDFERGTTEEIWRRWWRDQPREEKHARAQALSDQVPPGSPGKRSLQMTGTLGQDTGSHLFTVFEEGLEEAFVRFYTRFAPDHGYEHHFVCLGGYEPSTPWPDPKAGTRPAGDDRVMVFIDPVGRYGRYEPPGAWTLYTYWPEMKISADGRYWGNCLWPAKPALVPRGRWICVELMVRLNAPEQRDGELALWIDGRSVLHVRKGVRRGEWSGMGFDLLESGGEEFEGLRLRTSGKLRINHLWLEHYVDAGVQKQGRSEGGSPVNRVWFDDVVVARKYVGPVAPAPGRR